MNKSTRAVFFLSFFIVNTICGQNVASNGTRNIEWQYVSNVIHPISSTYSIGKYVFNGIPLPAISENFQTSSRSDIEFYDLEYIPFDGYQNYKTNYLNALKGEMKPIVWHSLAGSVGYTGFYICPYKEVNGKYFILKSFKYRLIDGKAFSSGFAPSSAKRALNTSVLATGKWAKISVTKDGIYKIDAALLNSMGFNTSTLDPRKIKIYGHHGAMLPEKISDFRHDDIPENAITVVGQDDGVFDNSDYILFYAQAPHKWVYNSVSKEYSHQTNIYSDKTYYFITVEGDNGKRILANSDGNNLTADASYNWFNFHEYYENEKENICREGRIFLGEKFDQTLSYSFNHNFPNFSNQEKLRVVYNVGTVSPSSSSVSLRVNGTLVDAVTVGPLTNPENCFRYSDSPEVEIDAVGQAQLNFTYNQPNTSSKAWLDYYELHCSRNLIYSESFMAFRNIQSASVGVAEFKLSNLPATAVVYDVTDPLNVSKQNIFNDNGEWIFKFNTLGQVRQFALTDGNYMTPNFEGEVVNQNLHATGVTQFIIVTHPDFLAASEKLADFHRVNDQMSVLVVTPQQIYNEYSSGSQDISAIRDFFRHIYYKNTNPANNLKYAMFMGDASYDYKDRITNNTNFVPVYESDPKLNIPYPFDYYSSDDFFGFLDSLDGKWNSEQKLEIAVSRMPVANANEAMDMVNKIFRYKDDVSLGDWRNVVTLFADDADEGWEKDFVLDFEEISSHLDSTYKNINVRKIYADAYKQENLSGSQRYPEAQVALKQEFEKGTLVFNYVGHGGEEYLTSEKIFDIPLINALNNGDKLPVFFTATCEFSRYDDVMRKSAGEMVITNPNGGAIAMFTTVRLVYAGANAALNKYFWTNCAYVKIGGEWPRLGDIYVKLKNWPNQNDNDRKFTLLADPALRMNYPEHVIKIDSINSASINSQKDTLRALSKVTFKGHVEDVFGQKLNTFNGVIAPIVYDKQSTFSTLSNDLPNEPIAFKLYSNILYKGENSVVNGDYTFSFVVPKDINYNYGYGKISMYADNGTIDASGHYLDLTIGGTASNAAQDVTGPQIELFIDDYTFISGGLTDNSPLLLARVYDENGINTSGIGIGRDIVAIIDKGTPNEKRFILNSFYSAKLNSYTTGDIRYQLEGLEDGKHTYTLKVWDVYNNSSEATIDFIIHNDDDFVIQHVLNYPNPFSTNTTFHFDHNKAGENLRVVITILTISGKVLKTIEQTIPNAESHVDDLRWDGRDDFDDKPSRGVYIYRITVTTEDGQKAEKVEKLVILN